MPFDEDDRPRHDPAALAEALMNDDGGAETDTAQPAAGDAGGGSKADPLAKVLTSVLSALAEAKQRPRPDDKKPVQDEDGSG